MLGRMARRISLIAALFGDERVHLNLWLFGGAAPSNGSAVDVVVESFAFAP